MAVGLCINGRGLNIGLPFRPGPGLMCSRGDQAELNAASTPRLSQAFDGNLRNDRSLVTEQINDSSNNAEDLHVTSSMVAC